MKKTYLLIASAALIMAGCANDDYVGGNTGQTQVGGSIAFNMQTSAQVRGTQQTEKAAATALGNMFIVWGEKNETDGNTATNDNLVFKNYKVTYDDNTANTTTSNTKNWEYVGIDPFASTVVSPVIDAGTKQTIKYWDLSASSYTFTAVSAKLDDLNASPAKVTITKNTGSASGTVYDKGYTINVKDGASTDKIYYADRNCIAKATSGQAFASPVTLTFRHFESKIRFAMYETIPGYKVVVTNVTYGGQASTSNFGVDGKFINPGTDTKFTVTYEDNTAGNKENKAKVAVDAKSSSKTSLETGTNIFTTTATSPLATASNAPTYDKANGEYTAILPYPENETDMKLTVSYDLISEDTGEKISCENKTAVVPAKYCQWKSNYAYTYIFKISDKSVDLYPITFDAVVEADEVGNQETITTVSEPSITTFAVDANKNVITGKNEYEAGNVIYASVVDQAMTGTDKVVTLTENNVKLYTVTSEDADIYPITEASVAQSLSATAATTGKKITATSVTINASGDTDPVIVDAVPAEDGTTRQLSALKWTATANTVYAVEYINGANKTYKIVKVQNN